MTARFTPTPRLLAAVALFFTARTLPAQVTSGSISGTVIDSASRKPVAGATIDVIHVPTGTKIEVRASGAGRYYVSNLRPGGPYTVSARGLGMAPVQKTGVRVTLGDATVVTMEMRESTVQLASVTIVGMREDPIEQSGSTTALSSVKINEMPTLSRSLQDLTRLTPTGNGISFGLANYRYNNLTIDGAGSNDAFGFSQSSGQATSTVPTGTPGGLARTQPISLDAVDVVTVKQAPFDVRVGGFTGASLNAVTKGGTNTTTASAYVFYRNASFVGSGLSGSMESAFSEKQGGGSLSGAFVQDKAFYFVNAEVTRRTDAVLYAPGTNGALLTAAQANQIASAMTQYATNAGYANFDPGNAQGYSIPANSSKFFGRLDFKLNDQHSLTVRDNFVDATAGNLERGAALNKFASADFNHESVTNSMAAELRSQLSSSLSNSLIAGFGLVSDKRVPFAQFNGGTQISPQVEIVDPQFGQLNLGSDRESAVYRQKTSTLELTDNLSWARGGHTVTLGTHNELYHVQYTFANSYNGRWQYPSLAAFLAEKPSRIRATYILADNSLNAVLGTPGADFNVASPSVYLQDKLAVGPLTLTPGIRVDATFTSTPTQQNGFHDMNSVAGGNTTQPFLGYTNDYGSSFVVEPRVGFQYDPKQDMSFVIRGGAGIFAGRMPFAWFAYPFLNNGTYSANVDYRPAYNATLTRVPLIVDPTQQKSVNTLYNQGNQFEINMIDNKFVMPRVAQFNLGTDFSPFAGIKATLEGTYSSVMRDIYFRNLDTPAPAGSFGGADSRPFYGASRLNGPGGTPAATDNKYSSVFLLTNTNLGHRYTVTGSLQRSFDFARTGTWDVMGAYTFGQAKDVANGQRNSPQSNWEYNQQVTPNVPVLTYSNFDIRHRVLATTTFRHDWGPQATTGVTLIYTGASGSPYSYVYNSDLNNDGSSNNDLIFIPRDSSQINLTTNNWSALDAFIKSDPYLDSHRGQYAERNGPRTPWNQRLDLRVAQDLSMIPARGASRVQITLDVVNFSNLVSNAWGKQCFVPNLNNQDVFSGLALVGARANGVAPNFSFTPPPAGSKPYQIDDFTSRWQMQLGLRYSM